MNLLCKIFEHLPINLDIDKQEADCARCGARLSVGYDGTGTVVKEEIAREGDLGILRDNRNGNLYPINPSIRGDDGDPLENVIALDSSPEGFEIQGWVPRNQATVLPSKGGKQT